MVSDEGDLVWDICAFVPSKTGLTKKVGLVGGLSKEVLYCSTYRPLLGISIFVAMF